MTVQHAYGAGSRAGSRGSMHHETPHASSLTWAAPRAARRARARPPDRRVLGGDGTTTTVAGEGQEKARDASSRKMANPRERVLAARRP
jgi:hypothetical protein